MKGSFSDKALHLMDHSYSDMILMPIIMGVQVVCTVMSNLVSNISSGQGWGKHMTSMYHGISPGSLSGRVISINRIAMRFLLNLSAGNHLSVRLTTSRRLTGFN